MANRSLVKLSTEEQSKVETSPGMTLLPSSLLEINCLLLLPQLLVSRAQTGRRGNISYAEVIEALLTAGFHFIGLRMVLLGVVEAADCAKLYSGCLPEDWKPHHLVGIFVILDNSYLFYVNFFKFCLCPRFGSCAWFMFAHHIIFLSQGILTLTLTCHPAFRLLKFEFAVNPLFFNISFS